MKAITEIKRERRKTTIAIRGLRGKGLSFRKLRAIFWILGLSILILADEWVKEGYLVKPEDFFKPLTHESLLAALWFGSLIWALLKLRSLTRKPGKGGRGCGREKEDIGKDEHEGG